MDDAVLSQLHLRGATYLVLRSQDHEAHLDGSGDSRHLAADRLR